jgi:type IV secretion system protein VirB5
MKNIILCGVLAATAVAPITISTANAAGVPVFDASQFARQFEQLLEAKKQLDQAKATYDQFRGNRDIGALFNQYGKYMPAEMQAMYRDYQSGDWSGLADKMARLKNSQKLTGTQKQMLDKMADQSNMSAMKNKIMVDDMFRESNARFAQIQKMANSIDLQRDPKAAADLLNRIQVENAMLQLQTNQLQMVAMMREAEKDLQQQQRIANAQKFNSSENKTRLKTKVVF